MCVESIRPHFRIPIYVLLPVQVWLWDRGVEEVGGCCQYNRIILLEENGSEVAMLDIVDETRGEGLAMM